MPLSGAGNMPKADDAIVEVLCNFEFRASQQILIRQRLVMQRLVTRAFPNKAPLHFCAYPNQT